jgi:DNA transformation protein
MSDLTLLPNIGPVLANKLNLIGVTNFEELEATGSVEAVIRIGVKDEAACYNMLYALEGAIRGVRWHALSKNEREKIKTEFKLAVGI